MASGIVFANTLNKIEQRLGFQLILCVVIQQHSEEKIIQFYKRWTTTSLSFQKRRESCGDLIGSREEPPADFWSTIECMAEEHWA